MKPTMPFSFATLLLAATWLKFEAITPKVPFNSNWELLMLTVVRAVDAIARPAWLLLRLVVPSTNTAPPAVVISIPLPLKPKISQFSMARALPLLNFIPVVPAWATPLILRFLRVTTSFTPAATTIPGVPLTRTEATWPPPPSRVMALVMVTAPNPPGSRASISPPGAVFEMAPAKVLQGAVRLHGLASSPTPDTHVRVACAWAMDAKANVKIAIASALIVNRNLFIWSLLFSYRSLGGHQ